MKLKVIATNVVEQCINKDYIPLKFEMEYNIDNSTLKEIREKIGTPISGIAFSKYYRNGMFRFNDNTLPYIIKKTEKIEFVPNIDETLISEFIETHQIKNDTIEIEYGFAQAGGPGAVNWADLWEIALQAIEFLSTIGGAIGFIDFIIMKFKNKKPIPHEFMEVLYKRDYWNHYELAEKLDINKEEAKKFLKAFGYSWDSSKKIYVIDKEKKSNIKKIIDKIQILDV